MNLTLSIILIGACIFVIGLCSALERKWYAPKRIPRELFSATFTGTTTLTDETGTTTEVEFRAEISGSILTTPKPDAQPRRPE